MFHFNLPCNVNESYDPPLFFPSLITRAAAAAVNNAPPGTKAPVAPPALVESIYSVHASLSLSLRVTGEDNKQQEVKHSIPCGTKAVQQEHTSTSHFPSLLFSSLLFTSLSLRWRKREKVFSALILFSLSHTLFTSPQDQANTPLSQVSLSTQSQASACTLCFHLHCKNTSIVDQSCNQVCYTLVL